MADYNPDKHCGGQRYGQPEGVLCTRPKGWGTQHPGVGRCKRHGGATQSHARAAELEIARRECDRLGIPIETDPGEALLKLVWEAAGNVEFYRTLVQALPSHPEPDRRTVDEDGNVTWERGESGVYGRTYHVSGVPTGEARPHVLVELYNQERKHLEDVASSALRAKVEERRVRVAEQQGELLARAVHGILSELGVVDRPEVPAVVRKHLTLLAG